MHDPRRVRAVIWRSVGSPKILISFLRIRRFWQIVAGCYFWAIGRIRQAAADWLGGGGPLGLRAPRPSCRARTEAPSSRKRNRPLSPPGVGPVFSEPASCLAVNAPSPEPAIPKPLFALSARRPGQGDGGPAAALGHLLLAEQKPAVDHLSRRLVRIEEPSLGQPEFASTIVFWVPRTET